MAEGAPTTLSRYTLGATLFLVAAGLATYRLFDISLVRVGEETLGAIIEVLLGVIAVGLILEKNRRLTEARSQKEQLIRGLYDVWRQIETAKLLMSTHRSVKTWSEQFLTLNFLDEPLSDVVQAVRKLDDDGLTRGGDDILRFVEEARALLDALRDEYTVGHTKVATKQEAYEAQKRVGGARPLEQHWGDVLKDLPATRRLLEDRKTVDDLKEAAAILRRELLGLKRA
jgi:hypothetical protein